MPVLLARQFFKSANAASVLRQGILHFFFQKDHPTDNPPAGTDEGEMSPLPLIFRGRTTSNCTRDTVRARLSNHTNVFFM